MTSDLSDEQSPPVGQRAGGTMFGPYRLVSLLGAGGMGEVWRAVDTRKAREVAIKVLGAWAGGDPGFARRFRLEAERAARLNSPNIIPIHDYGEIDGRMYIDMPLIHGTDLGELVASGPLDPDRAVAIVAQVGRALADAHRTGLVHRDVKPSNILVTTNGSDDHVYLIDFGIAHAADGTRVSMSGALVGSPPYMAPERFAGQGDHRVDVYALGCVLHEVLTGQAAFTAPNAVAYMGAHLTAPRPRPSAVRAGLPRALDEVVARALAKDPAQRFATVAELITAARAALAPPVRKAHPVRDVRPESRAVTGPVRGAVHPGPAADRSPRLPPRLPSPADPRRRARLRRTVMAAIGVVVLLATVITIIANSTSGAPPSGNPAAGGPSTTTAPAASPSGREVTLRPGDDTEAAVLNGWPLIGGDEFAGPELDAAFWHPFEGTDGDVVRTPDSLSVADGLLTITARGQESGGMAWLPGQAYGRWEVRARADQGAGYRPAVLLWPDAEDWPAGGEIDLLDAPAPKRDRTDFIVRHGSGDTQDTTTVITDVTQWHNYAVEWTPEHIVGYVDGQQVYRTDDPSMIPIRPMHLSIQQDVGPSADGRTPPLDASTPAEVLMQVDWVRIYGA